jgi:hypothetical protein
MACSPLACDGRGARVCFVDFDDFERLGILRDEKQWYYLLLTVCLAGVRLDAPGRDLLTNVNHP